MEKTKFKTMMCRHLQEKGFCSLQNSCYFAHSLEELRNESDPLPANLPGQMKPLSNYKTQLCKVPPQLNRSSMLGATVRIEMSARTPTAKKTFGRCRLSPPSSIVGKP